MAGRFGLRSESGPWLFHRIVVSDLLQWHGAYCKVPRFTMGSFGPKPIRPFVVERGPSLASLPPTGGRSIRRWRRWMVVLGRLSGSARNRVQTDHNDDHSRQSEVSDNVPVIVEWNRMNGQWMGIWQPAHNAVQLFGGNEPWRREDPRCGPAFHGRPGGGYSRQSRPSGRNTQGCSTGLHFQCFQRSGERDDWAVWPCTSASAGTQLDEEGTTSGFHAQW